MFFKFGSEDQKKSSSQILPTNLVVKTPQKMSLARNLRFCVGVHLCFLSWNETLLTLGGWAKAEFWGGTGPEMHFSGTRPVTFFGAKSLLGGHISRLGGTSSDLGARPRNAPQWRRAWGGRFRNFIAGHIIE